MVQFNRTLYSTTLVPAQVSILDPADIRIRSLRVNHTSTTVASMKVFGNDARAAKVTVTLHPEQ